MSDPIHFLDLAGLPQGAIRTILDEAHRIKGEGRKPRPRTDALSGRTLAMVFEKPSTRTRFSFDLAMREMGGDTIVANGAEMQLGRGEFDRRHRARPVALRRRGDDPDARP